MHQPGVTLDQAWELGSALPGVVLETSWGQPALKVKNPRGKLELMACVPTNKSAEPGSLLLRIDRVQRTAMIEEAPELFYAPAHYLSYDGVLVRLAQLTPELLASLLASSHNFVTRHLAAAGPRRPGATSATKRR